MKNNIELAYNILMEEIKTSIDSTKYNEDLLSSICNLNKLLGTLSMYSLDAKRIVDKWDTHYKRPLGKE